MLFFVLGEVGGGVTFGSASDFLSMRIVSFLVLFFSFKMEFKRLVYVLLGKIADVRSVCDGNDWGQNGDYK